MAPRCKRSFQCCIFVCCKYLGVMLKDFSLRCVHKSGIAENFLSIEKGRSAKFNICRPILAASQTG